MTRIAEINLLPSSSRRERQRFRYLPALAGMVLLAVVSVLSAWWVTSQAVLVLTNQTEERLKLLEASVSNPVMQASSADQALILTDTSRRISTINQLTATEVSWPKAFLVAESLVQKDIVLTSISYTGSNASLAVKFTGGAPSSVSFANYVDFLRQTNQISKVTVDSYAYNTSSATVSFTLTLNLSPKSVSFTHE